MTKNVTAKLMKLKEELSDIRAKAKGDREQVGRNTVVVKTAVSKKRSVKQETD
ncbi:MAG: hypothetical protein HRT89_00490 [Lentisphaeria bacterium]|nr:hypothetical protein [Lentisphaeria bacterium]NQZ66520.1 hypothetical protein [Lentisphaeria bacterium]